MDFDDKVILVTGASSGIGEAAALLFAERGAKLALVARNEGRLRSVAAQCARAHGNDPLVILADLATDNGCETTAKRTLDHFGRLDVLVNNAGVGARTCIQRADMESFDLVFNTNLRGVYNLTRLLVPALIDAKGNIVNVSSIAGSSYTLGSLPYGMAKAALDHYTSLISLELAPKGVRVNAVSPGVTISNFVMRLTGYSEEEYAAWLRQVEATVPLGKVCSSKDIAEMICTLAGPASSCITGANVPIDGAVRFSGGGNLLKQQMK